MVIVYKFTLKQKNPNCRSEYVSESQSVNIVDAETSPA